MDESARAAAGKDARKYGRMIASLQRQRDRVLGKLAASKAAENRVKELESGVANAHARRVAAKREIEASKQRVAVMREKLKALQTGRRGGQFYVAPSGEKVYVK